MSMPCVTCGALVATDRAGVCLYCNRRAVASSVNPILTSRLEGRDLLTTPIWYPSANFDAQSCHMAWGWVIVLTAGLFWGWWWAIGGLIGWAMVKEFGFDLIIEKDSIPSSAVDAAFYLIGGALGAITYGIWLWVH